jgi:hypothetical protein
VVRASSGRSGSDELTELVFLPVAVASPRRSGLTAPAQKKGSGHEPRLFVVERVLGYGWVVAGDRASLASAGDSETLPARLSMEECRRSIEALAARAMLAFGRGRAVDPLELEQVGAASYPFRLRYRRQRSGAIDYEAVDVVTGRTAGGPLRAAIAAALVDAHRALESP